MRRDLEKSLFGRLSRETSFILPSRAHDCCRHCYTYVACFQSDFSGYPRPRLHFFQFIAFLPTITPLFFSLFISYFSVILLIHGLWLFLTLTLGASLSLNLLRVSNPVLPFPRSIRWTFPFPVFLLVFLTVMPGS